MKGVLISIQPKWVEKIASGKKTIEVRKSRPKLETPFKCYIYETKGKQVENCDGCDVTYYGRGKVIGEFICDYIQEIDRAKDYRTYRWLFKESCLTSKELETYIAPKWYGYGWHISDLKIYEKPKELNEFKKENICYKKGDLDNLGCWERGCVIQEQGWCDGRYSKIERPPQSWGYVLGE